MELSAMKIFSLYFYDHNVIVTFSLDNHRLAARQKHIIMWSIRVYWDYIGRFLYCEIVYTYSDLKRQLTEKRIVREENEIFAISFSKALIVNGKQKLFCSTIIRIV